MTTTRAAAAGRSTKVLEPGLVNTPIKVKRANLATSNEAAAKSFDRIQHYFNLRTLVCFFAPLTHFIREHNWVHSSAGERIIRDLNIFKLLGQNTFGAFQEPNYICIHNQSDFKPNSILIYILMIFPNRIIFSNRIILYLVDILF